MFKVFPPKIEKTVFKSPSLMKEQSIQTDPTLDGSSKEKFQDETLAKASKSTKSNICLCSQTYGMSMKNISKPYESKIQYPSIFEIKTEMEVVEKGLSREEGFFLEKTSGAEKIEVQKEESSFLSETDSDEDEIANLCRHAEETLLGNGIDDEQDLQLK